MQWEEHVVAGKLSRKIEAEKSTQGLPTTEQKATGPSKVTAESGPREEARGVRNEAGGGRGGFPVKTLGRGGLWADPGRRPRPPRGCDVSEHFFPLLPVRLSGRPCAFYKPSLGQGLVSVVSLSSISICKVSNNRKSLSLPLWTTDQYKRLRQSGE